jgi:hypothetical protein
MSFLSGLLNVGKSVLGFFSGNSIGSTLARAALAGYALNKLTKSIAKDNKAETTENIDKGVRLQIPPASSNKVPVLYGTAHFGGVITDAELSSDNQSMFYCMTLAEKTGNVRSTSSSSSYTFKDVYWNDQRCVFRSDGITVDYTVDRTGAFDRSASGLIQVYCYAGGSSNGVIPQNYTGSTPNAYNVMPSWTANDRMTDLTFAVVKITYNRDKGITGLGNFTFEVENSMKDPGDVLYDLFTNNLYGAGISPSLVDTNSLDDLTTYSQTSVNFTDETFGGGQVLADRYQINGLLDTSQNVFINIEKVANSCASWISYDNYQGSFGVIINKTGSSVASFNNSNILTDITIQGTGLTELYNNVKVEFPNRDIRDRSDYVNIEIPNADRNANELDSVLNIGYELINEPIQAQLLGLVELKQTRVNLIISFETDYSYMNLKAGEIISVTDEISGFVNKEFRILAITENQTDESPLTLQITALEYDPNIYSVADLYRYTRSDDNGIITIANIGTPGTPQVTKFEKVARPRVEIETTSPAGVVEGIEYWYTTDINEPNDDNRSYILLGTRRPAGGGTFSSGDTVVLDVDTLNTAEFYVKTRGFNDITTGPFSATSGLVDFTPQQVTDAINDQTQAFDSLGGLATAIGLLSLLNGVDGLFGGLTGPGSLFDKIFGTFEDETGVDLLQNAQDGNLGPGSGTTPAAIDYLTVASKSPAHDGSLFDSISDTQYNTTGSCYIRYSGQRFSGGSLIPNVGNYYLYKSDDTLIDTKSISDCSIIGNVVEIPFATRDHSTDYYITSDAGVVSTCSYCPEYAPAIGPPRTIGDCSSPDQISGWRFNTARPNDPNSIDIPVLENTHDVNPSLGVIASYFNGHFGLNTQNKTYVSPQSEIILYYGYPIQAGTGSITVNGQSIDVETNEGLAVYFNDSSVYINTTVDFTRGSTVTISVPGTAVRASGFCKYADAYTTTFEVDPGPTATSSTTNGSVTTLDMDRTTTYTGNAPIKATSNTTGITTENTRTYYPQDQAI